VGSVLKCDYAVVIPQPVFQAIPSHFSTTLINALVQTYKRFFYFIDTASSDAEITLQIVIDP
jgi:hypothetical protein